MSEEKAEEKLTTEELLKVLEPLFKEYNDAIRARVLELLPKEDAGNKHVGTMAAVLVAAGVDLSVVSGGSLKDIVAFVIDAHEDTMRSRQATRLEEMLAMLSQELAPADVPPPPAPTEGEA
jgi:hypothetical protein